MSSTPPAATSCRAASIRTPISKCRSWAPIRPTISNPARARPLPAAPRWWSISACRRRSQSLLEALADVGQQDLEGAPATIPSTWRSPGGASRCSTRWQTVVDKGITSFKHFMAYKGALMVDDDEMYRVVPALRRAWRAAAGACREWRRGCRAVAEAACRRQQRSRGPRLFAPAGGGRRGDQPRHHDRRHGRRAALYRARLLRAGARGDPPRAPEGHARVTASR